MSLYRAPSTDVLARRTGVSMWADHFSFGYDLVVSLRPSVVVELGTRGGMSYFAFCQAAQEHGVAARCYAVDHWRGDDHSGAYDDATYHDVMRHNDAHYAAFSTLLRMSFDEAWERFEDETIDLLHIDGFHTYEAARADFDRWYPKVSPGGIILMHDVDARFPGYGVFRLWEELQREHRTFAVQHGYGLGLLQKPGPRRGGPLVELALDGDEKTQARLRAYYAHLALLQELRRKAAKLQAGGAAG